MYRTSLVAARKVIATTFFLLGFVLSMLQPSATSAAIRSCRTDPIVTLSNGYSFHVTASLATDASDVRSIVYTIRVPQKVTLTKLAYTGGSLVSKENVLFYSDQPAGSYSVDTLATTGTANVAVTATVSIGTQSRSVSGMSGAHLLLQYAKVP